MKPLYALLGTFGLCLLVEKYILGFIDYPLAARIGMSAMLILTGVAHFAFTKGMTLMLPEIIPFKKELVYVTGVIEFAAAAGLQIPPLQHITAVLLIMFFVVVLPANIYAAMHYVDYRKGTHDSSGVEYLWFRIPLQLFFVGWVYYFCL
jgi:uncharacterized membrane protein